jgi:hypothetical protein
MNFSNLIFSYFRAILNIKTKKGAQLVTPIIPIKGKNDRLLLLILIDYTTKVLLIFRGTPQRNDAISDVGIRFSEKSPKYKEFAKLKHPR